MAISAADISIEKIIEYGVNFCAYRDNNAFKKQIEGELFLNSSLSKKIQSLEKMIDSRIKLLRKVPEWELYKENLPKAFLHLIANRRGLFKKINEPSIISPNTQRLKNYCKEIYELIEKITLKLAEHGPTNKKPHLERVRFFCLNETNVNY